VPADARRACALDEAAHRAVVAWSRLHGFVSPELAGNFAVEIAALAV